MSRWYKSDLQIASPLGGFKIPGADLKTPEGRTEAIRQYVQHIVDAGIDVFAVTDHNSTEMLEEIREESRRRGITMFPGMELSTGTGADGVHLLLIGDPDADIAALSYEWKAAAGFNKDHPAFHQGLHRPSRKSAIDILGDLPDNTIAIAPHILTENGMASRNSIKEASIRWRCLHHDNLSAVDVGRPTDGTGWNNQFRARELADFPVLKRLPFISTSDAYDIDGLGTQFSWIRMYKPDLESLRQALLDFEARVFCDWDERLQKCNPNEPTHAYINKIRIEDTPISRNPLEVEFDPRINVIIGSRGAGKSTVVQALRAVYGDLYALPGAIKAESESYQREVLHQATVVSDFTESISGAKSSAVWNLEDGVIAASDVINVQVVTQKELFERTNRTLARGVSSGNLLKLVDEALEDDAVARDLVHESIDTVTVRSAIFQDRELQLRRHYAQSATTRIEAERKIATRKSLTDSLDSVRRKLAALDNKEQKIKLDAAMKVLTDKERLNKFLQEAQAWSNNIRDLKLPDVPVLTEGSSKKLMQPVVKGVQDSDDAIKLAVDSVDDVVRLVRETLASEDHEFVKEVSKAEQVKSDYEAKLEDLGVDLSQYEALQVERDAHLKSLEEVASLEQELPQLLATEQDAWVDLDKLYLDRRTIRQSFISMISERTDSIRFCIIKSAALEEWKAIVHEKMGFRTGDHVDSLQKIADWLWSYESSGSEDVDGRYRVWRQCLLSNDYSGIAEAGVSSSFQDRLKKAPDTLRVDLAAVRADDGLQMEFLKQGNDPNNASSWQDISKGSPGQRSAAMLAFTLSYGNSPLVLDQPEDDLDSALVSELIVQQFRDARWSRQLIVVTHDANIPVNTDAERTVVLENVDGNLRIAGRADDPIAGPIDSPQVRKKIQSLLEGGVQAFVNRERRYDNELSRYRADLELVDAKGSSS